VLIIFCIKIVSQANLGLVCQTAGSNLIKEAEKLTLCFLSENGSITDTDGKIIVQGSTTMPI
jgi:hypothetical protein